MSGLLTALAWLLAANLWVGLGCVVLVVAIDKAVVDRPPSVIHSIVLMLLWPLLVIKGLGVPIGRRRAPRAPSRRIARGLSLTPAPRCGKTLGEDLASPAAESLLRLLAIVVPTRCGLIGRFGEASRSQQSATRRSCCPAKAARTGTVALQKPS